jgi:cytochrome b561
MEAYAATDEPMPIANTDTEYGWVAIALHWIVALGIFGLFALGLWMTDLGYYHPWYNRAPALHESFGIVVLALVGFRLLWRLVTRLPRFESGMARWERLAALTAHWLMYALMLTVLIAGYLIPSAQGEPVSVFGWFHLPPLVLGLEHQADTAGALHYWAAWGLVALAAVHTLAALKHHFLDRDRTLMKILGIRR